MLSYYPTADLKRLMQRARAFVFAAEEDFGIAPVEAQACGTPVIALGKGGALETVIDSPDVTQATGIWFKEQTVESLMVAVKRFEDLPVPINPLVCRRNAEMFSTQRFCQELDGLVQRRWAEFQASLGRGLEGQW